MSFYVAPHKKPASNLKDPIKHFTDSVDGFKITTNSPYGKLDTLESFSCAAKLEYSLPTPVQKYAIPAVLSGHPLLCRAPTGMGKTLCFLLPLVESLKIPYGIKICVIAPTRELCEQIKDEALKITKKLTVKCIYGGTKADFRENYNDANILVAAPGKLLSFLEKKLINLSYLTALVLDEADKLMDMGFHKDIQAIKSFVPASASVFLFSATYSPAVNPIVEELLPENRVTVEIQNESIENIKQSFVEVAGRDKKLQEILEERKGIENDKILIFTEMKMTAYSLESQIRQWGFSVVSIHGNKEQVERQESLNAFKNGKVSILVATSVASRGIDVQDIKIVINYDFPRDIKDYIHRIGRTGRQGKKGEALSFLDTGRMTSEMKRELIDVLNESKNEIPGFLSVRATSSMTGQGGKGKGFTKRTVKKTDLAQELKDLRLNGGMSSGEKEDTEEDKPGFW